MTVEVFYRANRLRSQMIAIESFLQALRSPGVYLRAYNADGEYDGCCELDDESRQAVADFFESRLKMLKDEFDLL